jgi:hypothetical protein
MRSDSSGKNVIVIMRGLIRIVVTLTVLGLWSSGAMRCTHGWAQGAADPVLDPANDPFSDPPPAGPFTPPDDPFSNPSNVAPFDQPPAEAPPQRKPLRSNDRYTDPLGDDRRRNLPEDETFTEPTRMIDEVDPSHPDHWDVPDQTPASLDDGASLNPLLLKPLRDNTIGLEYVDRPAYYYGLWLCQRIEPRIIAQYARVYRDQRQLAMAKYKNQARSTFPQFVDIFQNPADYRGKPVTMQGYFRKLVQYPADENDMGIEHVYEGWIYTEDSQNNPAVVVFTQKPTGLKLGGDITEEVRFSGYFLKMYGYSAQDTTRKAPLFVAGTVQWFPARAANERPAVPPWIYGGMTALGILAVWGLWQLNQRPNQAEARYRTHGRNFDQYPPQEFLPDQDRPIEPLH